MMVMSTCRENGSDLMVPGRFVTALAHTSRHQLCRAVVALIAIFVSTAISGVLVGTASAQVATADRACINAFTKGLARVGKAHGKIVRSCTNQFSKGKLISQTPEQCIASDPKGKLTKTGQKEIEKITAKCGGELPDFGVGPIVPSIGRAVFTQFGLVHGSIGPNLDNNLIANAHDARCQAKVTAALLQCQEMRQGEYRKCQSLGLRNGAITDAASLATECLGVGSAGQPDPKGRIESRCGAKLLATVARHCDGSDLTQTFASCGESSFAATASCLSRETACQLCSMLNDTGAVERNCDLFDDGIDNGSCEAECGDGVIHRSEGCDDGNDVAGDGCSEVCQQEFGWTCTGEPSVCVPNCGNGVIELGETCDDGNTASGDGCSNTCAVESGYTCTGQPSNCVPSCGNGNVQTDKGEACDDGNAAAGDGCSSTCQVEPGYICTGNPSVCTFVCGNSVFNPGETCDDGNTNAGDGCSPLCQIEPGWLCSGLPSICAPKCGDGLIRGIETCDDGNLNSGDGCSFLCQVETGFACAGQPSSCSAICGDGFIRGAETCDDGNTFNGDGCSGTLCRQEFNYSCAGQPSVCTLLCGNGALDGIEECDDGNNANGDGCNANCTVQAGYACFGTPSACFPTCGNGVINAGETCDDGNALSGDGCSASCRVESGWLCPVPGAACNKFDVFINTPLHGIFSTAANIVVTGNYTLLPAGEVSVTVNGVPASTLNQVARTFSHTVPLSAAAIFNPILVTLTHLPTGDNVRDRIVVIRGNSVADGAFSPQSTALRLNDRGLDAIEPLVGGMAGDQLNIGQLIPPGTPVTSGCFIDSFLGCLGSADVRISSPAPSYGGLGINFDAQTGSVFGDINISNIVIHAQINGSGLVPSCGLRLSASNLRLTGNYSMAPHPLDASNIDVNLITPMGVQFNNFNTTFTSGICDWPIIGDIIQALLPDVQSLAVNGIKGFLDDPDGSGPQDSPIAAAIEEVLAGISITGPVGEGLGLQLESPLFGIFIDNAGITLGSNSRFTVSVGTGPGQCVPPPGAPDFTHSYSPTSSFPSFGPNSPATNKPYGFSIAISSSGFNQLLRGQTECGLMRTSLDEIDLDGSGPIAPLPINSTIFSALIPEFGQLPPFTPLRVDVAPSLAPLVTGTAGPNGELTGLKVAQMMIQVVEPGPEKVWLAGAVDLPLGMDLAFAPDGSGLSIGLGELQAGDLTIAILNNPLGANATDIEQNVLPSLVAPLVPDLAGALSGFPLPQFLGLQLSGVEVSRTGQFMGLYADLLAAP